jgi:hypothetical protein
VLGDLRVVDEGAVSRAPVAEQVVAIHPDDLRVVARHVAAGQPHVVLGAAADGELGLVERDDPAPQPVVQFETSVCHEKNRFIAF